jgi:ferredoxin
MDRYLIDHLLPKLESKRAPVVFKVPAVEGGETAADQGYQTLLCPVMDKRGNVEGMLALLSRVNGEPFTTAHRRFMSHIVRKVEYVIEQSFDAMTGLMNRSGFEAQLQEACKSLESDNDSHQLIYFDLDNLQLPTIKTTNCLLLATQQDMPDRGTVHPCIRCGQCAQACPARLLPQQLYWYARSKDFDKAQDHNLFDCIECGCCAYVCPSNLPLVQYYRFAKTEIWSQEREKKAADKARERHEFRVYRQEREKEEKAARHKARAKAVKKDSDDSSKKAAIQAAMERAKAKREAAGSEPKNTENLTEAQQKQIAEAEERRNAANKDTPAETTTKKANEE